MKKYYVNIRSLSVNILLLVLMLHNGGNVYALQQDLEGLYIVPLRAESKILYPSEISPDYDFSYLDINSRASFTQFSFLSIELSKSRPSISLTGIKEAWSRVDETGYEIMFVCSYNDRGMDKLLKAYVFEAICGTKSLETIIFDLDYP